MIECPGAAHHLFRDVQCKCVAINVLCEFVWVDVLVVVWRSLTCVLTAGVYVSV